jgi:hypothetical protein
MFEFHNVNFLQVRFWKFNKKEEVEERVAKHDLAAFIQVFNVTNLNTYTQYTFEVKALNSAGASPPSTTVSVRTTEDSKSIFQIIHPLHNANLTFIFSSIVFLT